MWCKKYLVFFSSLVRGLQAGIKMPHLTLNIRIAGAGVKILQLALNIRIARITVLHLCMPGINETYEIIKIIFKKASILFCNAKIIISLSNLMRPSVSVYSH